MSAKLFLVVASAAIGGQVFGQGSASKATVVATPELRVGVSLPLTGRASLWGKSTSQGLKAAADMLASEGLPLRLIVRDDANLPVQAAANVEGLVGEDRVTALVCLRDGPTIEVAASAARASGLPVVGVGGRESFRQPLVRAWFGVRATQTTEGLWLARQLAEANLLPALVVHSGEDSAEFRRGIDRLLDPKQVTFAPATQRDWPSLTTGMRTIVFDLDTATAAAEIKRVPAQGTVRVVSTRVVPEHLARAAGPSADGIYCLLPLPAHTEDRMPLARAFRAALGEQGADSASWEAFVTLRVLAEGLRRTSRDYSPVAVLAALETVEADLGDLRVRLGPDSHSALSRCWLGRWSSGRLNPSERLAP